MPLKIVVQSEPFDPWLELSKYQKSVDSGRFGAMVTFVGTLRDFNNDEQVYAMHLEHYPGMTEHYLEKICIEATENWGINNILLIHRYGHLEPGESIVLVAVWSEHRAAAFDACRFIINDLKYRASFWKQEQTKNGNRWVEKNTVDSSAAIKIPR